MTKSKPRQNGNVKSAKTRAAEMYKMVTETIIGELEKGNIPWIKPWDTNGMPDIFPLNISTKKGYRGINVLWLTSLRSKHGYSTNFWGTFKQLKAMGGQIIEGQKASMVVFFKMSYIIRDDEVKTIEEDGTETITTQKVRIKIPMLRSYPVFNIDQCTGIDVPKAEKKRTLTETITAAENLIASYKDAPKVTFQGQDRAFYRPSTDEIFYPMKDQFTTLHGYYATQFHELMHSTGHKTRLKREGIVDTAFKGSKKYSKEELTAEIGSAFMCEKAGIFQEEITQKAAYIKSWLSVLNDDQKFIWKASSQAQNAMNYIETGEKRLYEKPAPIQTPAAAATAGATA